MCHLFLTRNLCVDKVAWAGASSSSVISWLMQHLQGVVNSVSCFLFHASYKLDMVKISWNFTTRCENFTAINEEINESMVTFWCCLYVCQQSSSTFEQGHVFPPSKSCFPSHEATGARWSAVPWYAVMVSSQAFYQRTELLVVWWC